MTIIFLSRYQNRAKRGVENYADAVAAELQKYGHETEILTSVRQLLGKTPDIIYPLNGNFQALFCRLYSWLVKAKLVTGGHAGIGRDDRVNLYVFPDLFLAFSNKGTEWAKKVAPWIYIKKISHGVDLNLFTPKAKPETLHLQHPIVITVAHLDPYKRVEKTIEAVSKLTKASLVVLGEGANQEQVDSLGNELLGKSRYQRLTAAHKDVPAFLNAASIFTLVSESQEAFGLVYLEALACNLPVVATDDSLRREIVGPAGIFVNNPDDATKYKKALEAALQKSWGTIPLSQARRFSWKSIGKQYNDTLEKLVDNSI